MAVDAVPEWVIGLAVGVGTAISVVIARLGWKSGDPAKKPAVQVEGALVDSSSVKQLAAAVEAINVTLLTIHRDSETVGTARVETLRAMIKAITELAAHIERQNDLTEHEEERRVIERLESDNAELRRRLRENAEYRRHE